MVTLPITIAGHRWKSVGESQKGPPDYPGGPFSSLSEHHMARLISY